MIILPAIDLYEGKGVRLTQGDYSRMTVYLSDPVSAAKQMEADGAEWIHLVDLEGAKAGKPCNGPVIVQIRNQTHLKIEVGGGNRSHEVIASYLSAGIDRVILGTKALEDDAFLKEANTGDGPKFSSRFRFYMTYILPLGILVILIGGYVQKFAG